MLNSTNALCSVNLNHVTLGLLLLLSCRRLRRSYLLQLLQVLHLLRRWPLTVLLWPPIRLLALRLLSLHLWRELLGSLLLLSLLLLLGLLLSLLDLLL